MGKPPCVVIAGPTATGKSRLAVSMAKEIGGEIISADSMQVYRGMDIGSAKITEEERGGVRHYLIDCLDPEESFDVTRFQAMAKEAIAKILSAGKIPMLVGGTGFYIQAVLRDIDFSEEAGKSTLRDELQAFANREGAAALHDRLAAIDPDSAAAIHPNNIKRVIRALEFHELTGTPISEHNRGERAKEYAYDCAFFVLTDDRELLYRRIDDRVDEMIRDGLVDEVRALADRGLTEDDTSMKGLGYRQLFPYLRGECSLESAVKKIKTETRHFAKRQLIWFRGQEGVHWVDRSAFSQDEERMLSHMIKIWKEGRGR